MKKIGLKQSKFESLSFSGIGNLNKILGGSNVVATGPRNMMVSGPYGQILKYDSDEYDMDTKNTKYFHLVTDEVLTKEVFGY